jgi:hypothetical protein
MYRSEGKREREEEREREGEREREEERKRERVTEMRECVSERGEGERDK